MLNNKIVVENLPPSPPSHSTYAPLLTSRSHNLPAILPCLKPAVSARGYVQLNMALLPTRVYSPMWLAAPQRAANPRLPEMVHQAVNFLNTLPLHLLLLTFLIAPLVAAGAYDEDFEPDDSSSLNSGSALDDPEYFAFLHPMIAARMQAEKEATRFKAIDEWRHSIEAPQVA